MRISHNPSKNLIWIWLARDLKKLGDYKIFIDAACGDMNLISQIKTGKYIGFDIDNDRLKRALEKYPTAQGLVSSIENITQHPELFSVGDVVVCMQTLGINHKFDVSKLELAINNLILLTSNSGTLIINIRWPNREYSESYLKIRKFLHSNFYQIEEKNYGTLESLPLSKTNLFSKYLISIPLTLTLFFFPILRKINIYQKPSTYFVCSQKRTNDDCNKTFQ